MLVGTAEVDKKLDMDVAAGEGGQSSSGGGEGGAGAPMDKSERTSGWPESEPVSPLTPCETGLAVELGEVAL